MREITADNLRTALESDEPSMSARSARNIWIRLDKKAAEKQDAQKHNDCDDDDLNERHGLYLSVGANTLNGRRARRILEVPE